MRVLFFYTLLVTLIVAATLYATRALVPYVSGDFLIVTEPQPITPVYTIPQEANP